MTRDEIEAICRAALEPFVGQINDAVTREQISEALRKALLPYYTPKLGNPCPPRLESLVCGDLYLELPEERLLYCTRPKGHDAFNYHGCRSPDAVSSARDDGEEETRRWAPEWRELRRKWGSNVVGPRYPEDLPDLEMRVVELLARMAAQGFIVTRGA